MSQSCKGERAFTLLEVVMTIFFMGFALGTLSHLFAGRNVSTTSYVNIAWATQLAEEKVEEMYGVKSSLGYAAVNTTNFPVGLEDLTAKGYPGWTRQVVIEWALAADLDGTSGADVGLKRGKVVVSWPGGGSRKMAAIFANWP